MNRRSFLALAGGAPLAAIIPATRAAEPAAFTARHIGGCAITAQRIAAGAITTSKLAAGSVTAEKIKVDSLSAISARLANVPIRNATIGPRFVLASNIYAPEIIAERKTQ